MNKSPTRMSANILSKALQAKASQDGLEVEITGYGVQEVIEKARATRGDTIGFSSQTLKDKLDSKCAVIELTVSDLM